VPFVGIYTSIVIYYKALHVLPIFVIPIVAFYLGCFVRTYTRKRLMVLSIFAFIVMISFSAYFGMPNYLSYIRNDSDIKDATISNITLFDQNKEEYDLSQWKGKIVVLDFWNTACYICFKKFPIYNDFYFHYKDTPEVVICAVNLKLKQRTIEQIMATTEKLDYDFPFLYTTDSIAKKIRNQLNIIGVPTLVIIDQRGKVYYSGQMIIDKKVIFNNAYRMVDGLLEK